MNRNLKSAKIPNNTIVQVFGWVMLKGVEEGRYRVYNLGDGTYQFYKPQGKKPIIRHYITSVDLWVKDSNHPNNNKIVIKI